MPDVARRGPPCQGANIAALTWLTASGRLRPHMILTCPACDTKYVVKDDAIPPAGRQVRCASCKHSWHQDPELSAGRAGNRARRSISAARRRRGREAVEEPLAEAPRQAVERRRDRRRAAAGDGRRGFALGRCRPSRLNQPRRRPREPCRTKSPMEEAPAVADEWRHAAAAGGADAAGRGRIRRLCADRR